ncbi:MAG: right-handed parallel beta-helix repeat-containing protein [Deltaproteobacteria bacterium]|nr:right-handed parallel beta-helix repeat-containing protein [Deltaproteobacteria bacterium]
MSKVALACNGLVALGVSGTVAGRAGPSVVARRLSVFGTRAVAVGDGGLSGGDGILVNAGADLTLDPELRSDAMRGLGSQLLGNARAGTLASSAARLRLSGARVAFNRGPGVFVQDSASALQLGYNWFQQNRGLAVGVTSTGSIAEIVCNTFTETIPARLRTNLGELDVADGVSVAGSVDSPLTFAVAENIVSQNPRFGMLFTGPMTVMLRQSSGTVARNGFPIGAYSGAVIQGVGYNPAAQPRAVPGRAEGAF